MSDAAEYDQILIRQAAAAAPRYEGMITDLRTQNGNLRAELHARDLEWVTRGWGRGRPGAVKRGGDVRGWVRKGRLGKVA